MADDKQASDVERMDAPNQEAVGQPPPWVEGSGGEAADPVQQQTEAHAEQIEAGQEAEPAQPPTRADEPKPKGGAKK